MKGGAGGSRGRTEEDGDKMWEGMKWEDENIKWEETREVVCVKELWVKALC
jgi:hypothetical protein